MICDAWTDVETIFLEKCDHGPVYDLPEANLAAFDVISAAREEEEFPMGSKRTVATV